MPIDVEQPVDVDIEEMKRDERFRGYFRGYLQGAVDWMAQVALWQLECRIGKLSERTEKRIRKLPSHLLCRLILDLLDFKEPSDLTTWLRTHKTRQRGWYFTPEGVVR